MPRGGGGGLPVSDARDAGRRSRSPRARRRVSRGASSAALRIGGKKKKKKTY